MQLGLWLEEEREGEREGEKELGKEATAAQTLGYIGVYDQEKGEIELHTTCCGWRVRVRRLGGFVVGISACGCYHILWGYNNV